MSPERYLRDHLPEDFIMDSVTQQHSQNILLADDHKGEGFLFKDALKKIPGSFNLTTVHNGIELMNLLNHQNTTLPDVLFLELIMPLKDGFECLSEIKTSEKLKQLPIIIFSSFNCHAEVVDELYQNGARLYVRKPGKISQYKTVIYDALH